MVDKDYSIVKTSGKKVKFSFAKLKGSLKKSGASDSIVQQILDTVQDELYDGISTNEVYHRAFAMLKKGQSLCASKYKLKKAIYELGPTGFPFEKFIASLLTFSGYKTNTNTILNGRCVTHEIDVLAIKNGKSIVIECKFHSEEGRNCNVKIPLYIQSRYKDIREVWNVKNHTNGALNKGWVVTNTRFTKDAIKFGKCCGLYLLSWDYPKNNGIKDRTDRLGLYPITVSTLLTKAEKQFLLDRGVVLGKQLLKKPFFLDHLGISEKRKSKIIQESKQLSNPKKWPK